MSYDNRKILFTKFYVVFIYYLNCKRRKSSKTQSRAPNNGWGNQYWVLCHGYYTADPHIITVVAHFQYNDFIPMHGDYSFKDETFMRPSYTYIGKR